MVDPSSAMQSLQQELTRGLRLESCVVAPNLRMIKDQPGGEHRFTYALMAQGMIHAYCAFVTAGRIDGVLCFSIGYAVPPQFRNQGLAAKIIEDSIRELSSGLRRAGIGKFYVEAMVGKDNIASQKVAARVISRDPKEVIDQHSGEPALVYHRLVE